MRIGPISTPKSAKSLIVFMHVSVAALIPALAMSLMADVQDMAKDSPGASDGDSVGVILVPVTMLLLVLQPLINYVANKLLSSYPGSIRIFIPLSKSWRGRIKEGPWIGVAAISLYLAVDALWWRDYLFAVIYIVWIYLALCFRAVLIRGNNANQAIHGTRVGSVSPP